MKDFNMMNEFTTWKQTDSSERGRQTESGLRGKTAVRRTKIFLLPLFIALCSLLVGCDEPYGALGGADKTVPADIVAIMEPMRGVWYSHYGARRLDSYRIGKWKDFVAEMDGKISLFPNFTLNLHDGYEILNDDYYIFYDDTVYGQGEDGSGSGNGGWDFGFIGIVRAVNIFNDNPETGAVIIEYLDGAYPMWSNEVLNIPLPFFGIFYRVLKSDVIQMANAVDLAALAAGNKYHTEMATLEEAVAKNSAINDGEFISWGVVIPQDREE
jgi:hypothetical protein